MIVNDNLTKQSSIVLEAQDIAHRYGAVFLDSLNLVEGATYTFSANLDLSEGSEGEVIVFDKTYTVYSKISMFSTKNRSGLTFVYKGDSTHRIACYAGLTGSTAGVSARYTDIKLEKGNQMTPYLPHKSKVKSENQAIFPIGGVSRSLPYIVDIRGLVYVN